MRSQGRREIGKDFTAEDWDGFKKPMEASNIQDKNLVLRVVSMYSDPEQREREIKNISAAFTTIADEILPQLRRARMQLTVNVIGKSDEEIARLAMDSAQVLTVDELLYAATLTEDLNAKAAIYQKVIDNYGKDVRGYNNPAWYNCNKAMLMPLPPTPQGCPHRCQQCRCELQPGVGSPAKTDLDKAQQYFGHSAGTSGDSEPGTRHGVYMLKGRLLRKLNRHSPGSYEHAVLVQILNEDHNGACRTLAAVATPNAMTSYPSR